MAQHRLISSPVGQSRPIRLTPTTGIGRVGALAVALGVGIALSTPAGIARADDTNNTAGSSPGKTHHQHGKPTQDGPDQKSNTQTANEAAGDQHGQRPGKHRDHTKRQGSTATDNAATDSAPPAPADTGTDRQHKRQRQLKHRTDASAADPKTTGHTAPAHHTEKAGAPAQSTVDTAPAATVAKPLAATSIVAKTLAASTNPTAATVQTITTTSTSPAAPNPIRALLAIPGGIVTTIMNALKPLLFQGSDVPANPPLIWALLAWTRRQFINDPPKLNTLSLDPHADGSTTVDLDASDPDGDHLSYSATNGAHGTVTVDPAGDADGSTFTYTPAAGYVGTDTFTITASDKNNGAHLIDLFTPGGARTASTTVTVTVAGTQAPQVDAAHPYSTDPAQPEDPAGTVRGHLNVTSTEPVTYTGPDNGQTGGGTVTVNNDGSYSYTPTDQARHDAAAGDAASTGADQDSFTITVTNDAGSVDVPITVPIGPPLNAAPTAPDDPAVPTVDHGTGQVTGQLGWTDPDGDALSYSGPADGHSTGGGTVTVNDDGSYSYTPTGQARLDAYGTPGADTDTFTATVDDGHGGATNTLITVPVDPASAAIIKAVSATSNGDVNSVETGSDGTVAIISVSGSGNAYQTLLTVVHPDGSTTTHVSDGSAINWGGVQVGADGTTAYTARTGSGAADDPYRASIVVVHPDGSVTTHSVDGFVASTAQVGADGTAAYSSSGAVVVIRPDGTAAEYPPGSNRLTIGGDGTTAFTTQTGTGTATDPYQSTLTLIHPDGTTTSSATVPGYRSGSVQLSNNDTAVYTTQTGTGTATDPYQSTIVIVASDGSTTTHTIGGTVNHNVQLGADGTTAFADQTGSGTTQDPYQTTLTVVHPDGTIDNHVVTGATSPEPVFVGANGTSTLATQTGSGTTEDPYQTTLTVVHPDGTTTTSTSSGVWGDDTRIGDDGTVAYVTNSDDQVNVTVVHPSGTITTTSSAPGYLGGAVGSDGTTVYSTQIGSGTAEDPYRTILTSIAPNGTVATHELDGYPDFLGAAGPDGTVYQVTSTSGDTGDATNVLIVRPDGDTTTTVIAGYPAGFGITGDGTAYVTSWVDGVFTVSTIGLATETALPPQVNPTTPYTADPAVPGDPAGMIRGHINAGSTGSVSYSGPADTTYGTLTVNTDGSYAYVPTAQGAHDAAADGVGPVTDTFTITVANNVGSVDVPITVTVTPYNQAPTAPGSPTTPTVDPGDGAVTGTLGYTDPDGDTLTYTGPAGGLSARGGTVTVNSDGTYTYQPADDARHLAAWDHAADYGFDTDSFTITVADGHGSTTTIPVSVTVVGADQAPTTTGPTLGTPATIDGAVTGSLNVTDADHDGLTYTLSTDPTRGAVTVNPDGTFSYTPTPPERLAAYTSSGDDVDSFVVTVSDAFGKSTVITVDNVPISPVSAAVVSSTVLSGSLGSTEEGPDGKYYMTVSGGTDGTRILIFDPADPTHPTTVDTGGTTSYGGVVFTADGKGYQLSYTTAGATSHSYLSMIDPANPTTPTVIDLGDGQPTTWLTKGTDSNFYVPLGGSGTNGHLAQIDPADPTHPVIVDLGPGSPSGNVIFGPDDKLYMTTTSYSGTSLVRMDPADITHPTIIATGPGTAYNVTFGTDGTIYATSYSGGWGGSYTNYIAVITPANPDQAGIIELPPSPSNSANAVQTVYGPDGTAYVTASQYVLNGTTYSPAYYLSIVSPSGGAALATLALPSGPGTIAVGPDGTAFVQVTQYGSSGNTNTVMVLDPHDPTQPVTVTLPGTGYVYGAPVLSPDGTAFALSTSTNGTAVTYYLTTIDPHTPAQAVDSTIGTYPSSAYISIKAATDSATAVVASYNNQLDAIVVSRDDPTHPITTTLGGNTNWSTSLAADGTLYAVTDTYTSGVGTSNWHVTVIDPDHPGSPTVVPLTGQPTGNIVTDSAGNALLVTGSTYNGSSGYTTSVLAFSSAAPQTPTTITIPGIAMGTGLIATSDGRAVLGTYTNSTNPTLRLAVIDPANPTGTITQTIPGTYTYSPKLGPDGRYYVSVGGSARVIVIDPADPTHATIVPAAGQNSVGDLVFGSDGMIYQSSYDVAGSVFHGYVSIIDPTDTDHPTVVDLGDGSPTRAVTLANDGNYYVPLSNTSTGTGRLAQIDPDGPTHPVIFDVGTGTVYDAVPTFDADGAMYFSTYTGTNINNYVTRLVRVDPSDPTHPRIIATVAGAPRGATVDADNDLYETSYTYTGGTYTFNTAVVTADHPDSPVVITTIGQYNQAPDDFSTFTGGDGTLYVSRVYYDSYLLSVVNPQQPAQATTVTLPGSSKVDEAFAGPDGTVYIRSTAYSGNSTYTSYLTVIDPLDPAGAINIALPSNYGNYYQPQTAFSPDGTLYVAIGTNQADGSYRSSLIVVDPDNPSSATTVDLTNSATYPRNLVVTDDVALVGSGSGIVAVRRDDPNNPMTINLPAGASVWDTTGADGVAYVTGYSYGYNSSTYSYDYTTYVLVVDANDLDHPAIMSTTGYPGGTVIIGSDGTAVQPVTSISAPATVTLLAIQRAAAPTQV